MHDDWIVICVRIEGWEFTYRIAVPSKDYIFQKEDIVICILPDC